MASGLWNQAFDSLDQDLKNGLKLTKMHRRDVLEAVLSEIQIKRDLAVRKRWKFKKRNGDIVIIRDVLEKTARWINKFKETVDVVAQYDPAHLSLPWAAFRFLLQAAVSDFQIFGAMADQLEAIARVVARTRELERLYLRGTKPELEAMLEEALTCLYAEILTHLARAVRFLGDKPAVRLLKSPFRMVDEDPMQRILVQESEVFKVVKLTDTDTLLHLEASITRLSVRENVFFQSLSERKYNKLLDWLSPSLHHNQHQFISQSRLPGLGNWLLNHSDYIDWQASSSSSLLLLNGITGSGKTMLCSMMVDALLSKARQDPSTAPFGYMYCANPDTEESYRSSDEVMRFILGQLALDRTGQHKIKELLCSEYKRQVATASIDRFELPKLRTQDCTRLILELAEQEPLTILVDAIDTVTQNERYVLISALEKIILEADNVVKILVTSRSYNCATFSPAANKQIEITGQQTHVDMKIFANHMIDTAVTNKVLLDGEVSRDLRSMLVDALLDGAGEMFLWARLQVERLCREKLEDDVILALQSKLPEDLDQLYQKSLNYIYQGGATARDTAIKVFTWILHLREPLTPAALLYAVSDDRYTAPQLKQLIAICANFIVLDQDRNVVRFAHPSVKEFLERDNSLTSATAHTYVASTCIEACSKGPESSKKLQLPSENFYAYAAMYWPVHANTAENMATNKDIVDKLTSFIFDEDFDTTLSFDLWHQTRRELVAIISDYHGMRPLLDAIPDGDAGVLFLVSAFGLTSLLRVVLERMANLDVNQQNEHGHTPVYLAALRGHSTTISLLVDHGANVNIKGGRYGSPLHAASIAGHLEVVDILLKCGASIYYGDVFHDALQAACRGCHEDVSLHLIENGTMITSEDDYEHALQSAARAGFVRVIELLQLPRFTKFNKNQLDPVKMKIRKAIQGGQLGVIRHFLSQHANKTEILPSDAVALATLYNHKHLVNFFLHNGMSVEAEGIVGTPLRTACLLGFQSMTRLLLHQGAKLNTRGTFGDALQAAAMKGNMTIVKLMIEEGAEVNQQSGFYGTALQAASYHGHRGAAELLLDAGADVYAKGRASDAFYAAAEGGHEEVIMLMLKKGYKFSGRPDRPDRLPADFMAAGPSFHYKPLMEQASFGQTSNSYGQRKFKRISKYRSAKTTRPQADFKVIFRAVEAEAESRITEKIESRITEQTEPRTTEQKEEHIRALERACRPRYISSPLEAAASAGQESVVKLLLSQRWSRDIPEHKINAAIKAAASNSHQRVIELLLKNVAERQPTKHHIESVLKIGLDHQQSHVVDFALTLASKHCSIDETAELKQRLVKIVDKYLQGQEVSQETLILDFGNSCKTGNIPVINAILGSRYHETLSVRDIDGGLQLCALKGQNIIAQMLLESSALKERRSFSGEEAFVAAASSGFINMMELLVSCWTDELTTPSGIAMKRALVVSSKNGHIDVVQFLVQDMSADINLLAYDKPVGPSLNPAWDSSTNAMGLNNWESRPQAGKKELAMVPIISPLQAALQGFSRFDSTVPVYTRPENEPRKATKHQHEQVIVFLLENGCMLNDLGGEEVYPIQLAAKICPPYIVEKFISAGADVNAIKMGPSALMSAAGRELSAAPIVHRLLASGAAIPKHVEEQQELLNQALSFFGSPASSTSKIQDANNPQGRFSVAPSLQYVFQEGSGAVLFEFLLRMPQIITTDIIWNLVLQMTVLLDDCPFVDLLLSRGTDVNNTGYYYGTALQAAARCGHADMASKLLNVGAKVNVIEGRWQTALRAAVIGGHADVVELLLSHGADIELGVVRQSSEPREAENALQLAVRSGNLRIVKMLLKHGADAVLHESESLHPLILASKQGNVALVQELLNAGAPVNVHGRCDSRYEILKVEHASPIHAAVTGCHWNITKLLLSHGADIRNDVKSFPTVLSIAISHGQYDIAHLLLSAGAGTTDQALSEVVKSGNVEFAKVLLAAGSRAAPSLALACSVGHLPMIELLLENIYDSERSETVESHIDEAFAGRGVDDSVFRLLLDYVTPTQGRFVRVCAAGSVASLSIMLDGTSINVNSPSEGNGDYPLQAAASLLQIDVVRFLLSRGAVADCKSAKHGTPLICALESCAGPALVRLRTENARKLIVKLYLPITAHWITSYRNLGQSLIDSQELSSCEEIVRLLIIHGANIDDNSRPFGPPLHLACMIGSESLVKFFLEKGANLDETAGYFEQAIFAAMQGEQPPKIVKLLLETAPMPKHRHPDYATPLHLACAIGNTACVSELLKHGADATSPDAKGRTPLTIALLREKWNQDFGSRPPKTPSNSILNSASQLHISDNDLVAASELGSGNVETLTTLLDIAKDLVVCEAVICRVIEDSSDSPQIIKLLMQRNGGIGVTAKILRAVQTPTDLEQLLKHKPVCQITPEILTSQKQLECMKLLLYSDPKMRVTEQVIFRALEIWSQWGRGGWKPKDEKDVLEILFDRSPDILVTDEMMQAARCEKHRKVLLKRLEASACISTDVVAAPSKDQARYCGNTPKDQNSQSY